MSIIESFYRRGAGDPTWRPEDDCWTLNHCYAKDYYCPIELGEVITGGAFLGLCAGSAGAELGIANHFGFCKVTLVDKKKRIIDDDKGLRLNYIESDIFDFINDFKGDKFSLVTVLGGGYVLEDRHSVWRKFWVGMDKIVMEGGLVFISDLIQDVRLPDIVGFEMVRDSYNGREIDFLAKKIK